VIEEELQTEDQTSSITFSDQRNRDSKSVYLVDWNRCTVLERRSIQHGGDNADTSLDQFFLFTDLLFLSSRLLWTGRHIEGFWS
jgi:hypothetical protein